MNARNMFLSTSGGGGPKGNQVLLEKWG